MFDLSDSWGDDAPDPSSAASASPPPAEALEALLERVELRGPVPAPEKKRPRDRDKEEKSAAPAAPPAAESVELGFVSPYPGPALPEHFPSKVGGRPVWLLPERLPSASPDFAAARNCALSGHRP